MNLANILHSIAETDPEVYERTSTRRRIIRNWMPKVALTTLPLTLTLTKRMISSRGRNTMNATAAQRMGASKRCGLKENPRPSGEIPVLPSHRGTSSVGGSERIQLACMSKCQPR